MPIHISQSKFSFHVQRSLKHTIIHSKFAPPTPNLLHPLIFGCLAHVTTLYQSKTKTYKSLVFLPNANKYPCPHLLCSLILHIHSTPLAHSPHPLYPLLYNIRQRRKNAHETVSVSASPSTIPVFKFKFLYYAPHQRDKYV